MYYRYINYMVKALAHDAKSLIDVGSSNAEYIERFNWIPIRHTLDINNPYQSENVKGFKMDFMDFKPEAKYDFATCFQVLEHIPDVVPFTRKLFEISDRVLISVPFMWEEGSSFEHIHDPVDLEKLLEWTGREPDYYIVVQEPLFNSSKNRRLICYYHLKSEILNVNSTRKYADQINNMTKSMYNEDSYLSEILKRNQRIEDKLEDLENKLLSISYEQRLNTLILNLKNELELATITQKEIIERQTKYLKKINDKKETMKNLQKKSGINKDMIAKYKKQKHEILSSSSWEVTKPLRLFFGKIKKR